MITYKNIYVLVDEYSDGERYLAGSEKTYDYFYFAGPEYPNIQRCLSPVLKDPDKEFTHGGHVRRYIPFTVFYKQVLSLYSEAAQYMFMSHLASYIYSTNGNVDSPDTLLVFPGDRVDSGNSRLFRIPGEEVPGNPIYSNRFKDFAQSPSNNDPRFTKTNHSQVENDHYKVMTVGMLDEFAPSQLTSGCIWAHSLIAGATTSKYVNSVVITHENKSTGLTTQGKYVDMPQALHAVHVELQETYAGYPTQVSFTQENGFVYEAPGGSYKVTVKECDEPFMDNLDVQKGAKVYTVLFQDFENNDSGIEGVFTTFEKAKEAVHALLIDLEVSAYHTREFQGYLDYFPDDDDEPKFAIEIGEKEVQ